MIGKTSPRKIVLVAKDQGLIDGLNFDGSDDYSISKCVSVISLLQQPELRADCAIIVVDIDDDDDDGNFADGLERLRKVEPGLMFIVVGAGNRLKSALTPRLQALSYRVFAKPVNAKQLLLAFDYDDSPIATAPGEITVAAPLRWPKPVLGFAALASLLAVIGWGASGSFESNARGQSPTTRGLEQTVIATAVPVQPAPPVEEQRSELQQSNIDELKYLAALAQGQQRLTAPAGDNALYYYNAVLELDPFDTSSFLGRKKIVEHLRQLYVDRALAGAFDRALEVIVQLHELVPTILQQYKLREGLLHAIHLQREKLQNQGNHEQLASLTTMLQSMLPAFPEVQSELSALQVEQAFKASFDDALAQQRLLPPQQDSAFSLVMAARDSNSIAAVNLQWRVNALADTLIELAEKHVAAEDFAAARALVAPLLQLTDESEQLAQLSIYIEQQQQLRLQEDLLQQQQVRAESALATPSIIIPASIVSRTLPRYPARARRKKIEGWVELRFDLGSDGLPANIEILAAEPKGVFDLAARNAVNLWRFSPAMDSATGLPVSVEKIESKVVFALQ